MNLEVDLSHKWEEGRVSALVTGLSGPGLSPGRGTLCCVLVKTLYCHSASLSPKVYKCRIPANLMLGGNPAMD